MMYYEQAGRVCRHDCYRGACERDEAQQAFPRQGQQRDQLLLC